MFVTTNPDWKVKRLKPTLKIYRIKSILTKDKSYNVKTFCGLTFEFEQNKHAQMTSVIKILQRSVTVGRWHV